MQNDFYNTFDTATLNEGVARPNDYRSPFQLDRDRIIHTSAFRRLQSKTQVFLSGEYDFYRTRLTHSIEVAQIGRSICARLKSESAHLGDGHFIDPDLVEATCLAHDLGHPPYGHAGERILNRVMKPFGGFEGNAQTLRMLTETIYGQAGMNPTRAFLDGILKYKSLHGELEDPENHFIYTFQSPYLDFSLGGHDFPAEFTPGESRDNFKSIECRIMDWADDTAYSLNDIADGIQAGFITLEKIESWASRNSPSDEKSAHIEALLRAIRDERVESRLGRKIGDFIAAASLSEDVNFLSAETNRYRYKLEVDPALAGEAELYKSMALDIVFRSEKLQQLDHKADIVITALFDTFCTHYLAEKDPPRRLNLLPSVTAAQVKAAKDDSARARLICDHLAAMTDGFATRTYKRLFDPDFGSIMDLV